MCLKSVIIAFNGCEPYEIDVHRLYECIQAYFQYLNYFIYELSSLNKEETNTVHWALILNFIYLFYPIVMVFVTEVIFPKYEKNICVREIFYQQMHSALAIFLYISHIESVCSILAMLISNNNQWTSELFILR